MNARELAILDRGGPEALAREAKRQVEERRRAAARRRPKRGLAPGRAREDRRAAEDAREGAGKVAAMKRARARASGLPRCEWHENGQRCGMIATDSDHVLGGVHKREMEALPNGDGFMALCAPHHRITKHGPDRAGALAQAKEHAIRLGARGLLRFVEAAIRRYEAKHPRRLDGSTR